MAFLFRECYRSRHRQPFLRTVQRVSSESSYIKTPLTYDELAISYALCLPRYLSPCPPRVPLTPPPRGEFNVRQYEGINMDEKRWT